MAASEGKKANSAAEIIRKLEECKKHLQKGNLFSSIVQFRDVLDAFISGTHFQVTDKSRLTSAINNFQRQLVISQFFNDIYGKVYFRDNDFSTSYDFLCQLIKIKEDEIADVLLNEEVARKLNLDELTQDDQKSVKLMISLVERGESQVLQEMVSRHENLGTMVLSYYNGSGIDSRKSGNIEKAIIDYKKALTISPNDEHLYYNLARAYIECGQKKNAEASITQALQLNPDFKEGIKLFKYIKNYEN
jgi:tetratricopeptide (TPR) repeat protein